MGNWLTPGTRGNFSHFQVRVAVTVMHYFTDKSAPVALVLLSRRHPLDARARHGTIPEVFPTRRLLRLLGHWNTASWAVIAPLPRCIRPAILQVPESPTSWSPGRFRGLGCIGSWLTSLHRCLRCIRGPRRPPALSGSVSELFTLVS